MSSDVLADLIISFVLIGVGIGFIIHGQKLKNSPSVKLYFASSNIFIILGVLILTTPLVELANTYI